MTEKERIEEIHGLWELAVTNVATLARQVCADERSGHVSEQLLEVLKTACREEQELLGLWQRTTLRAIEEAEESRQLAQLGRGL